jgi:hypothetical protein
MKLKMQLLVILLSVNLSYAQDFNEIKIKETYDVLLNTFFDDANLQNSTSTAHYFGRYTDDYINASWGLLDMYRTTKDVSYIVYFSKLALWIQANRIDRNTNGAIISSSKEYSCFFNQNGTMVIPKLWYYSQKINSICSSDSSEIFYQNGMILSGLTEFLHLINIEYPNLRNVSIIDKTTNQSVLKPFAIRFNFDNETFNTIGEFADWLLDEVAQSMPYLVKLRWNGESFAYIKDNFEKPDGLNYQSLNSTALNYYGMLRPSEMIPVVTGGGSVGVELLTYSEMAYRISAKYNGNRDYYSNEDCESGHYTKPVFEIRSPYNSLKWFYNTWRPYCGDENQEDPNDDFEDVSHAVNSIEFILATEKVGRTYFSDVFMTRLHNTFTQNVVANYYSNNCNSTFHAGVDGDDEILYRSGETDYNGLNARYTISSFWNFMPLYQYDGYANATGSVYEIILNQLKNKCFPFESPNGMYHMGLARCAKAQWQNECSNNTLYNRKVVYDQDFLAKHNLLIDPLYSSKDANKYPFFNGTSNGYSIPSKSFADPQIVESIFTIEANVQSTISAGNSVSLKGEVHFKAGAEVHLKTIQNNCFTGGRISGNAIENDNNNNLENTTPMDIAFANDKQINNEISNKTITENKEDFIVITSASNSVVVKSTSPIKDIFIYSISGTLVQSITNINETQKEIGMGNLSSGLYIVRAQNTSEIKTQKVNFLRN